MENYIISNKTIALIKNRRSTIIVDKNKIRVVKKGIKDVINQNCMLNGKNLDSIKKYSKRYLNIKYKIPIVINKNIILIQINSIRNDNSILFVNNKIIDYYKYNRILKVKCVGNYVFYLNISKFIFNNLVLNAIKISNKLE